MFIYLNGRTRERENILWLPKCWQQADLYQSQSKETKIAFRFLMCVAGIQVLGTSFALLPDMLVGSWIRNRRAGTLLAFQYGMQASQVVA